MKRERSALFVAVLVLLIVSFGTASQAALQTFESGNAGWLNVTVNNSGQTPVIASPWQATAGNPDGHLTGSVDDGSDGTRLYGIQAPFGSGTFGDLSNLTLTVDYKIEGEVTGPVGAMARFYIGHFDGQSRYWVSNDTFSWDPNADTTWTTHRIDLQEENFMLWPNQSNGSMTFSEVLSAYNDIGLVFADGFTSNETLGFSSENDATIHIDNFGTVVPIPGGVWLLGSMLGLVVIKRKASN